MLYMTDKAEITQISDTDDGRIVVSARVARGGNVQLYRGAEMGMPEKHTIRVYRPADEVFDMASMRTFPHKLVTLGHPKGKAIFDEHGVGWIGDEVARDGEFIRVPMTVAHRKAVDAVKSGQRELSVGYNTDIEFENGVSPTGEQYDAKMTNIVVDHVAIVPRARGGTELRIGDWSSADSNYSSRGLNTKEGNHMPDVKLTTVTVDGFSVETTDAGAQAIARLSKDLADERASKARAETAHAEALKAKDKELATKDAKIEELGKKVMSDEAMDKAVKDRADLITTAKGIADVDYSGKTADDIRKMAVVAKLGADSVKDKSADYIAARFDILAEDAGADPVRRALKTGDKSKKETVDAYDAYVERISNAYKGETTKETH